MSARTLDPSELAALRALLLTSIESLRVVESAVRTVDVPGAELAEAATERARVVLGYLERKYGATGTDANGSPVS